MSRAPRREDIEPPEFRSGFAAMVGRPNVGKSTLVNALVGEKIAIVSRVPQTTRHRIAGVVNLEDCQIILLDLPGFQKPRDLLTGRMQSAVEGTLGEVDLILLVLNAHEGLGTGDRYVAEAAFATGTPVIAAINKIDLAGPRELLPMIDEVSRLGAFEEIFPISALKGKGLKGLVKALAERMPPGPMFFPQGEITDQPEQTLVAELIREQALKLTREEIPHAVAVRVLHMGKRPRKKIIDVEAVIIVERESQKAILIGKGGSMIREIGSLARREIEALLGSPVFLDLSVKTRRKWRDDERALSDLGL